MASLFNQFNNWYIINGQHNHDLVQVIWVTWVRNAPEQEAIIAKEETKVVMRKAIEEETLALQKLMPRDT